ncbi:hypothetical protein PF007_g15853 [Phytophthora fragariae]|uniref:Uncharacterized protein n=2 Tax=Phytophthora TaxID=4783 RepID=A0A6A4FCZ2_9STRA|nr:hypothetical protein PF003_g32277 [Phytophthora fragariae]KAE9099501.1 hypothetical protein PF007_g15853 [Phytophthora fragariae]KAE9336834.1 hypothetical protein PR003_g12303 [Phytophthora rubi]
MQKLVEVADTGMNLRTRSRIVRTETWQTLSRHHNRLVDLTVGMYAIDSLRQLSMKFLMRRGQVQQFRRMPRRSYLGDAL